MKNYKKKGISTRVQLKKIFEQTLGLIISKNPINSCKFVCNYTLIAI
jgi:hypothetical protein